MNYFKIKSDQGEYLKIEEETPFPIQLNTDDEFKSTSYLFNLKNEFLEESE